MFTKPTTEDFLKQLTSDTVHYRALGPKGSALKAVLTTDASKLKELNTERGIFFVVNSGGNNDDDITKFNAFFMEIDSESFLSQSEKIKNSPLPPAVTVQTRKSLHAYWPIEGNCTRAEWDDIQQRLIAYFKSDPTICNPSRVMRLPGFDHIDAEGNRKPVTIRTFRTKKFTVEQMQQAYAPAPQIITPGLTGPPEECRHKDLWEKIKSVGTACSAKAKGAYETRCPVHTNDGKVHSNSSLVAFKDGGIGCHKNCGIRDIRLAFGLPVESISEVRQQQPTHTVSEIADYQLPAVNGWGEDMAAAQLEANPVNLFGNVWTQGEICVCFGDTGSGKTALMVQISDALSKGKDPLDIPRFNPPAGKLKVLYFDFELTRKQQQMRYSAPDGSNLYDFDSNHFKRVEINKGNPRALDIVEQTIRRYSDHKIVVVDNITAFGAIERADFINPIIDRLNNLKKELGLSLLIGAHTPKIDLTQGLTLNQLGGSKNFSNFADAVFAVGKVHAQFNQRYLLDLKVRSGTELFTTNNVGVFRLSKPFNFLHFTKLGEQNEQACLRPAHVSKKKSEPVYVTEDLPQSEGPEAEF